MRNKLLLKSWNSAPTLAWYTIRTKYTWKKLILNFCFLSFSLFSFQLYVSIFVLLHVVKTYIPIGFRSTAFRKRMANASKIGRFEHPFCFLRIKHYFESCFIIGVINYIPAMYVHPNHLNKAIVWIGNACFKKKSFRN